MLASPITGLTLHTDGGSRGNPGPSAWAVATYYTHEDGSQKSDRAAGYLGTNTNNYAEHYAMNQALTSVWKMAKRGAWADSPPHIRVYADSRLVVEQVNRTWAVKPGIPFEMMALHSQVILSTLRDQGTDITVQHFRREFNVEADALVNMTLDRETNGIPRR